MNEAFTSLYPHSIFLDFQLTPELITYLQQQQWVDRDETIIALEKPGEGNMNFVMRVRTDRQTFIVKQARPWVQKYPQVAAPVERVAVEAGFYACISNDSMLQSFMPTLKGYDPTSFTIALEDLGAGGDFTYIYQKNQQLTPTQLTTLIDFISRLHTIEPESFPANTIMKQLNHEHIFRFPFDETTGFDLDMVQSGLAKLALSYRRNTALKAKIESLGNLYLKTGKTLLHGDFYPGSWLNVASDVKVIDPEFSFMGCAEFDMGVLLAHLKMARNDALIPSALAHYQKPIGFKEALMWGFAGTELIRRLIGLAQLPLELTIAEKEHLLTEAASWIG